MGRHHRRWKEPLPASFLILDFLYSRAVRCLQATQLLVFCCSSWDGLSCLFCADLSSRGMATPLQWEGVSTASHKRLGWPWPSTWLDGAAQLDHESTDLINSFVSWWILNAAGPLWGWWSSVCGVKVCLVEGSELLGHACGECISACPLPLYFLATMRWAARPHTPAVEVTDPAPQRLKYLTPGTQWKPFLLRKETVSLRYLSQNKTDTTQILGVI